MLNQELEAIFQKGFEDFQIKYIFAGGTAYYRYRLYVGKFLAPAGCILMLF